MMPEQMMAHCTAGLLMAMGEIRPPRVFIGRLIGLPSSSVALRDEEPMRRNSPTAPELLVADHRDFAVERERIVRALTHFAAPAQPVARRIRMRSLALTPDEWGVLMYKHLDHHLRQFGA